MGWFLELQHLRFLSYSTVVVARYVLAGCMFKSDASLGLEPLTRQSHHNGGNPSP
jgi:hypothetical protein